MVLKWIAVTAALVWLALAAIGSAQSNPATGHTLILVRVDGTSYAVVGRRALPGGMPRAVPRAAQQGWNFEALDAAGAVIHTGALANPHVVRGDFQDAATGETTGLNLISREPVTFAIRVPENTSSVVLYDGPAPSRARAGVRPPPNVRMLARIAL